jgi:hypothetical protein
MVAANGSGSSLDPVIEELANDERTLSASERALLARIFEHKQPGESAAENLAFRARLRQAVGSAIAERVVGVLAAGVAAKALAFAINGVEVSAEADSTYAAPRDPADPPGWRPPIPPIQPSPPAFPPSPPLFPPFPSGFPPPGFPPFPSGFPPHTAPPSPDSAAREADG